MGLRFRRKVGAAADAKELEYIIALLQTANRDKVVVSSLDTYRYLRSRYGLQPLHLRRVCEMVGELGGEPVREDDDTKQSKASPMKKFFAKFVEDKNSKHQKSPANTTVSPEREDTAKGNNEEECKAEGKLSRSDDVEETEEVEVQISPRTAKKFDSSAPEDEMMDMKTETPKKTVGVNEEDVVSDSPMVGTPGALEEYLDLVQLLALVLIPTIVNASVEFDNGKKEKPVISKRECNRWIRPFVNLHHAVHSFWIDRLHSKHESIRPDLDLLTSCWRQLTLGNVGVNAPAVDKDFVKQLLLKYGEIERAQDTELIQEMVDAATTPSGVFDDEAWIRAISSGLDEWSGLAEEEYQVSTFFEDVFGTRNPRKVFMKGNKAVAEDSDAMSCEDESERKQRCSCNRIKSMFRSEVFNIDMVTDSHASLLAVVVVWVFYIVTVCTYGALLLSIPSVRDTCDLEEFGCQVLDAVYTWLVTACVLCLCGIVIILPTSLGNSPYATGPCQIFLSIAVAALLVGVPPLIVRVSKESWEDGTEPVYEEVAATVQWEYFPAFQFVTLATGAALIFFYLFLSLCDAMLYFIGKRWQIVQTMLRSSNARAESRLKVASLRKMKTLVENAFSLHRDTSLITVEDSSVKGLSAEETVMKQFVLRGEQGVYCGGAFWTWYQLLSGHLFSTEGIWINTRLIIMQVAQLIVGVLLSAVMLLTVNDIADEAEAARSSAEPGTPQWALDLIPTRAMVNRSLYPASFMAMAVMFLLIGVYIPSATTTILRYRCQDLPSSGSPYFQKYREAVDSVYTNAANGVWGMAGSALVYYLLIAIILFLFQWPFSQSFMIRLLGWCIGLGITITLKMILTMGCRAVQYRSFFRIRPAGARVSSLLLECWFIGVGASVIVGRIGQFLFAAALWVGRIDVNFLSEDVNALGYAFDYVPLNFTKDLLVHEAHRHPWIERLGQILLMKLKSPSFCSRAGVAWRQLAVLSLCPWLAKYRLFDQERRATALRSFQKNREEEREDEKNIGERLLDVQDAALDFTTAAATKIETGLGFEKSKDNALASF